MAILSSTFDIFNYDYNSTKGGDGQHGWGDINVDICASRLSFKGSSFCTLHNNQILCFHILLVFFYVLIICCLIIMVGVSMQVVICWHGEEKGKMPLV